MKILIISYYYTPAISPRAFRWTNIAEYWAKEGNHVDVICSCDSNFKKSKIINGVNIHRVGNSTINVLRKQLKNNDSVNNKTLKNQERLKNKLLLVIKWAHDYTWKKVYWPDFACLWYFPALRKAKKLLKVGKYDKLITVSIPFTCHMVGLKIKKIFPKIKWLMDIGDPFYLLTGMSVNNYKMYKRLNYITENKVVSRADFITVTTEVLLIIYRNVFPESNKKIYVIPPLIFLSKNNIDTGNSIFLKKDTIKLVFVGTLYKAIRSPNFLLKLFRKLLQTSLGYRLELHFFGSISDCTNSFELYKDLLNKKIFLHGLVSHNITLRVLKEADFLINIGNNTSYQLPSKVVEYMSSGKPIINLILAYNDSSLSLIKDYPLHINIIDSDIAEDGNKILIVEQFIRKSVRKLANPERVKQIIEPFSKEKVIEHYSKVIYRGDYRQ